MQQELIDMLEEIISYVEVWHEEDQDVIDRAEALVEKAKNNAPAVQVYQLAKLGGPTETAWIDVTQEVYEDAGFYKDDFKRRILSATPASAPAQYRDSTPQLSVGESSFESWFESYNPANKGDKQRARDAYAAGMGDPLVTAKPAQEVGLTDEERADMACAVAAICTGTSSRTVAATAIEWTERALRAKEKK